MSEVKNNVRIMDVSFVNATKSDFLHHYLFPCLYRKETCFIVTANPEIVMKTKEDAKYNRIVQSADYVVPDGAGILLAAKLKKQPLQERIAGFDLMMDLLAHAEKEGWSCYFLGAEEAINAKAVQQVREKFPGLHIAGRHHGFFALDNAEVAQSVRASKPDIIFVALGLPRQEQWIAGNKDSFAKGLFIGVGGSLDVLAGEVRRAPDIWIKLNLEWLYRLLQQPFRWKRILKVFEFIFWHVPGISRVLAKLKK